MANNLTVASVIDKNRVSSPNVWLILLDIFITDPNTRQVVETLRIVRNNENVIYGVDSNGDPVVYTAGNFEFQIDQRQNAEPNVSITAHDQLGLIQSRMEAYAGGILSEVQMTVVNATPIDGVSGLNSAGSQVLAVPEMQERFQITQSSAKEGVVSFQLGSENSLGIRFPKHRQQQDRCAWRFKGYGCQYAGPVTVCDYTKDGPNGCTAKGNTINFRALPGLVRVNI